MQPSPSRIPWIDYLRGFIIILVIAVHASLPYTTFPQFDKIFYTNSTHPIVDVVNWKGIDILEDFIEIFIMPIMFLISGIFITHSLQKKGFKVFMRDRFYRLFIPFVIGTVLLMLITYYPSYCLAYGKYDIGGYIIDFFTVQPWPIAPPWFLWVLFLFNLVIALLFPFIRRQISNWGQIVAAQQQRPLKILLWWYVITWLCHVPIAFFINPGEWTRMGPFAFQTTKPLFYFSYFFIGIVTGSTELYKGIWAEGSALVKKWPVWLMGGLGVFILLKLSEPHLDKLVVENTLNHFQAMFIYRSVWILYCTLACMACLAVFKTVFQRPSAWWGSLAANAYGIYLLHYIFVIWCQYFLLYVDLPATVKFLLTIVVSLLISWWLTHMLRKIKVIEKYL